MEATITEFTDMCRAGTDEWTLEAVADTVAAFVTLGRETESDAVNLVCAARRAGIGPMAVRRRYAALLAEQEDATHLIVEDR